MLINNLLFYTILIEAAIALFYAYKSWRTYRFPAWVFLPMVLLIEAPHFIFPIFLTSEKNAVKKAGGCLQYSKARLKMGWGVVLYYFLMFSIFLTILVYTTDMDKVYLVKVVALASHIMIILYIIILFTFTDKIAKNSCKVQ